MPETATKREQITTLDQQRAWLKSWLESGREALAAQVVPETINEEERTVDVTWFTGVDVARYSWSEGPYTLRFDPKGVDLSYLNAGAPVLDNHWLFGCDDQKGKVERAWVDGKLYKATLRFSKHSDLDRLWGDIRDGIVSKFSMGTEILELVDKRNKDNKLEMRTATKWRPFEISCAPIPADFGTTTLQAETAPVSTILQAEAPAAEAVSNPETKVPETIHNGASAQQETTMVETQKPTVAEAPAPEPVKAAAPAVDQEALRQEAAKDERLRVTSIQKRVKLAGLSEEFAAQLVNDNVALETASEKIFAALAENSAKQPDTRGHVAVIRDSADTFKAGAAAGILYRFNSSGLQSYKVDETLGREYGQYSVMDLAKMSLEVVGRRTHGLTRPQIADEVLSLNSTSDFPNILADVANKTLMAGYTETPRTFTPICTRGTIPDFKDTKRVYLGESPVLPKVPETGEFTYVTVTEGKEQYRLYSYGYILGISRQAIINDDLSAFTQIPMDMGSAAARTESDIVWAIITANAAMADGVALFHATHKNLGTAAAISVDSVGEGRALMSKQTGRDGKTKIFVRPSFLVVPSALETKAEQFTAANLIPATQAAVVPVSLRSLTPIAEPRLDDVSAISWYLFANPATSGGVRTIEYSYLQGQEGVAMDSRPGFNRDGVEFKVRMDFGAKALDWRGMAKNPGA